MSNSITKATVATVDLGELKIEGLLLPDGSYAIAARQVAELISAHPAQASRQLKLALSKSSERNISFLKIKTDRNDARTNSNPETVLTLEQFSKALTELAFNGNEKARDIVRLMSGLSLRQLFADAFGEKFEVEERQEWLKQRMAHRQQFHPCLTKWLQIDGVTGKEYGKQVNLFKAKAKCPLKSVSEYDSDELHQLNNAEVRYDVLRRTGMSHIEAVSYLS